MIRRLLTAVSAALACIVAPAAAHAQTPFAPDSWFLSPALGIAFDPDADVSLAVAGAAGFPITPMLAVEGELGHLFDMAPDDPDVDSSLTTVHGALLYLFQSEYVAVPYVAAGLGFARFSHEVDVPPASIDATEIGFNLGGGVTYPIGDRVWIRGDFRYFKHIDDVPSAWRLLAAVTVPVAD